MNIRRISQISTLFVGLVILVVAVAIAGVAVGSTTIPVETVIDFFRGKKVDPITATIIYDLRIPRTITAMLAGAALGTAGLQMQTLFRNPLADPYILGISSGATFAVALVVLLGLGTSIKTFGKGGAGTTTVAASLGAATVVVCVLLLGQLVRSSAALLLLGVMFGAFISAGVTVMLSQAGPELMAEFITWGFGSYHGVSWTDIPILAPVLLVALVASVAIGPVMNTLLLGDRYASTMGINVKVVHVMLIMLTSVLAGATTAFCGPIQFLGIAIPHLARALFRTADHKILIPATILTGAILALAVDIFTAMPESAKLPLNAGNAVVGAPVVIYILIRNSRKVDVA